MQLIRADLYRYAEKTNLGAFLFHYLFSLGFRYTVCMRWCAVVHANLVTRILLFPCAWLINRHQQIRFGIAISYETKIGPGLYIGHQGGISINEKVIIGKNCNLSQQVTIGVSRRGERAGVPVVGDNVYIGPGAKIFGNVRVGNNADIRANCVVTRDVPDFGVMVGVPGKVISLEGSIDYINKTIDGSGNLQSTYRSIDEASGQ